MTGGRPDRWEVHDDGDRVWVERNGAWYSDADDLDDAVGILQGQRVKAYTLYSEGRTEAKGL